jgi:hypothetical protein
VVVLGASRLAAADVAAPDKWVDFANKKLGVKLRHPANAKVEVRGGELRVTGPELPAIAIAITATTERASSKAGGARDLHVEWTIAVPKRTAKCTADAADTDQATAASRICDTIELEPGARDPHVELTVASTGLADADAFERAVRAKQKQLDKCWRDTLAKDRDFPQGSAALLRTYDHGQLAASDESVKSFQARDAKPLGSCLFAILKAVPVKPAGDAAEIRVDMICLLY